MLDGGWWVLHLNERQRPLWLVCLVYLVCLVCLVRLVCLPDVVHPVKQGSILEI